MGDSFVLFFKNRDFLLVLPNERLYPRLSVCVWILLLQSEWVLMNRGSTEGTNFSLSYHLSLLTEESAETYRRSPVPLPTPIGPGLPGPVNSLLV